MLEQLNDFDQKEFDYIVGRNNEISLFSRYLESGIFNSKNIWNIYGTGGVGKSTLLQVFRLQAQLAGACYLQLDSRDFSHTGHDLYQDLFRLLTGSYPDETEQEKLLRKLIQCIREVSAHQKVILAFDTFEELADMEAWLRENLFKWLPEHVLVLIAGRLPLKGPWLLSPAWRARIRQIPIGHFSRTDSFDYLRRCGIHEEEQLERIWLQSQGHPLTLSLRVAAQMTQQVSHLDEPIWFQEIVASWLKEVPHKDLRKLVEIASVLRHFNQELLSYLLMDEVDSHLFEQLIGLSFVKRSDRGWMIHDLMREATCALMRERTPNYYRSLLERCARYYASIILERSGKTSVSWEVVELFHYVEDASLRAIKHLAVNGKFFWEPLTESTMAEAEAYVEYRLQNKISSTLTKMDPQSGVEIQIQLSAEESTYLLQGLDLRYFHELDSRCIKLLRSEERDIVGITVLVPLHEHTLPYLSTDPIFQPFLAQLSPADRHWLESPTDRPAGWFVRALDYLDATNPTSIAEGMNLVNSYSCNRGILVISPQPNEVVNRVFLCLGFEIVPEAVHCYYDGRTPTPYFIVDTRGDGLHRFISRLFDQSGMEWELAHKSKISVQEVPVSWDSYQLTQREQDVARLVIEGSSNANIAQKLYISEVTVKKHLTGIFGKVGVKNRTQLIGKLLKEQDN